MWSTPSDRSAEVLEYRSYSADGVEILTTLVDRPDTQAPTSLRGHAVNALAYTLLDVADLTAAGARAQEALAIGRSEGDQSMVALALAILALVRLRQTDLDGALAGRMLGWMPPTPMATTTGSPC